MDTVIIAVLAFLAGGGVCRTATWLGFGCPGVSGRDLEQLTLILDGGFWAAMPASEVRRIVEDAQTIVSAHAADGSEADLVYDLQTMGQAADGMTLAITKARRRVRGWLEGERGEPSRTW